MTESVPMSVSEIPRRPEVDVCSNCQRFYADSHYEKDQIITRCRCNVTNQIVTPAMRSCQYYRPIRQCR